MLTVNQQSSATDLLQALEGESGVFQATGPNGQQYDIICRSGQSIISRSQQQQGQGQQSQYGQSTQFPSGQQQGQQGQWRYRKVAELTQQGF